MQLPIVPATSLGIAVTPGKPTWPTPQLAVGEAFVIPMDGGIDPEGRTIEHVRVLVSRQAHRLGRRFSCRKTDDGLAVVRTA